MTTMLECLAPSYIQRAFSVIRISPISHSWHCSAKPEVHLTGQWNFDIQLRIICRERFGMSGSML